MVFPDTPVLALIPGNRRGPLPPLGQVGPLQNHSLTQCCFMLSSGLMLQGRFLLDA